MACKKGITKKPGDTLTVCARESTRRARARDSATARERDDGGTQSGGHRASEGDTDTSYHTQHGRARGTALATDGFGTGIGTGNGTLVTILATGLATVRAR